MHAQAALDQLSLLSTQVVEAVLVTDGDVSGATTTDERAAELALIGGELLAVADGIRTDGAAVEHVRVTLDDGGVLVVRDAHGLIVATTVPDATSGLVLYDLRAALRQVLIADA
jgi:hypothetical protein